MIIDEMITDRTQADVDEVYALKAKFVVADSVGSYILVGRVEDKYLVFTGTQTEYDKYMGGLRGAFNYTDLNRIGNAIRYLQMFANGLGIYPNIVGKNDWNPNIDHVETSDIIDMLNDLITLKAITGIGNTVPDNLNSMTYETANELEAIIVDAYQELAYRHAELIHSGTSYSGVPNGIMA